MTSDFKLTSGAMSKREILQSVTFGSIIAEDERHDLESYFVETEQWKQVNAGTIDVVYGPKGSGKSAIYALLLSRTEEFFDRGIIVVPAENPQGTPAFKDLVDDPPTSEAEFRYLWKLYFLMLIAQPISDYGVSAALEQSVIEPLREAGLLAKGSSLSGYVRNALDYVRRWITGEKSVETELKIDPLTGMPAGVSAKITFKEPSAREREAGKVSADELFRLVDEGLAQSKFQVWILLDRLDVAFAEVAGLERNALRALFRVYSDLRAYSSVHLKIFLRTDIWRRILDEGFRESSHITRYITIAWDYGSLMNLVIRRALHNKAICDYYQLDASDILKDMAKQEELFYRIFPEQVDLGSRRPDSFTWMLDRTCDGTKDTAPREVIHLLSCARQQQLKALEVGSEEPSGEQLFSRAALTDALPEVSRFRCEQTLCAEFPELRKLMDQLEDEKTDQTPATLARIWQVTPEEALASASHLAEIGVFEKRGTREEPRFWVPFLYRSALNMVQGAAD